MSSKMIKSNDCPKERTQFGIDWVHGITKKEATDKVFYHAESLGMTHYSPIGWRGNRFDIYAWKETA